MATSYFQFSNDYGIPLPSVGAGVREEGFFFRRFRGLVYPGQESSIIGRGGSGVIHIVRDEIMDRVVALKLPNESILSEPQVRSEVLNEASQALELTHPNIVRIFDFHDQDGRWGISMQFVRGKSLDKWRDKIAPYQMSGGAFFDVEQIKPWVLQLCEALSHAHEEVGIVHCDIKPPNLLLERWFDTRMRQVREKLLLTDFGITQKLRDFTTRTQRHKSTKTSGSGSEDGGAAGTLAYMSPQQLNVKEGAVSDDVYAIGMTIYELLTGKPAFYQGNMKVIQHQIETVAPPSMTERRRERGVKSAQPIPDLWEQVTAQCLHKDADKRPSSVRELARLLGLTSGMAAGLSLEEQRRLQKEADSLKNTVETQEVHIVTLTHRVSDLEVSASGKVEEAALIEARTQMEALQADLRRKEAQLTELDEKLQDIEEEKLKLEDKLAEIDLANQEAAQNIGSEKEAFTAQLQQAQAREKAIQKERDEARATLQKSEESITTLRAQQAAAVKEAAEATKREKTAETRVKQAQDKAEEARKAAEDARRAADDARAEAERKAQEARAEAEQAKQQVKSMAGQQAAPVKPLLMGLLALIAAGLVLGAVIGALTGGKSGGNVTTLAAEMKSAIAAGSVLVLKRHVQAYLSQLGLPESTLGDHFASISPDAPVTGLSWLEAAAFCDWLTSIASPDPSGGQWYDLPSLQELSAQSSSSGRPAREWTREQADAPAFHMKLYSPGQSSTAQTRHRAERADDTGFHIVLRTTPR
jgi:serine/threonine protein kinase